MFLLFHDSDYTIASASDGEAALRMTERLKPDLVLLDMIMPKMNGFDYLKSVKSNPVLKDIPVIVLSNLGDKDDIEKATNLGAMDYYIKLNTDLATLADKVAKILKI